MKKLAIIALVLTMLVLTALPVLAGTGENSWGVGVGIPYGLMGVNLDLNLFANVDLSLGLGLNPTGDGASNIGTKIHLASPDQKFRPRISYYYGTNTIVSELGWYGDIIESTNYNGVSVGFGGSISFGRSRRHGLDFDLIYIVSTEADIDQLEEDGYDVDNVNDLKISIGYRKRF